MRAIPPAGGAIFDTASGKSGPVGPAQPATATKSSDAIHLSVRAINAVLSSRVVRRVVAPQRCADFLLNIAHGGELVLRLRGIDDQHDESVAREVAVAAAILPTAE